jgi:8-oxo-dGTP pyrophosphatase MutT (NUDIX family)
MEFTNHPLSKFKYCPSCGSINFKILSKLIKKCEDCNFSYSYKVSGGVAVIIKDKNNKILLTKRKFDPSKGTLDLPGGFIDIGENAELSCEREIKEETGLNLNEGKLKYLFSLPNVYKFSDFNVCTLDLFYEYFIDEFNNLIPGDDVDEIVLVDKKNIDVEKFGLQSIRQGIKKYIEEF